MGTNYHVNGIHVGKTSARGRGNGYAFIWAMSPREFMPIALEHDLVLTYDEYRRSFNQLFTVPSAPTGGSGGW